MANSADSDQLASSEANWSGVYTVCKSRVYPGSAGQGLKADNSVNTVSAAFWKWIYTERKEV